MCISLEKRSLYELPLIRRETGQRIAQRLAPLSIQYDCLRGLDGRGGTASTTPSPTRACHGRAAPLRAQAIDRAVARHAHDPRQRSAHSRVVGLGARPHADEHLLQDLLRLGAIADDAQDETEEQPAVAIVQLGQCGGVARGDALQKAEVSGIVACIMRALNVISLVWTPTFSPTLSAQRVSER